MLLASPMAFKALQEEDQKGKRVTQKPLGPQIRRVGQTLPGEARSALELSRGALGAPRQLKDVSTLSLQSLFGRKHKNV